MKIIDDLKEGHRTAERTNDHYEYLIRIVCDAGERFFNIPNCWNDIEVRTGNEVSDLVEGAIPKSSVFLCFLKKRKSKCFKATTLFFRYEIKEI